MIFNVYRRDWRTIHDNFFMLSMYILETIQCTFMIFNEYLKERGTKQYIIFILLMYMLEIHCLFVLVLWHINPCRLFNTKSHHHHVAPSSWISLILYCHPSLSSIASGRSSSLHPVWAQSCCMLVLAGHPILTCPCDEVHRSMWLMSSSLIFQQCVACLLHLT